jgi:hypothetical protein
VHPLYAEVGEIVTFEHLSLMVWGKGLIEHAPANRPMAGVPPRVIPAPASAASAAAAAGSGAPAARAHDHWFVGMAHGHFVEDRREPRSSLITPDEIEGSGLDYLALGHVHVFRDVSQGAVRACYPGAPRISYAPDAGSVAIIRLDPVDGVSIEERRLGATILDLDSVTEVDIE